MKNKKHKTTDNGWKKSFDNYVQTVQKCFAFLGSQGYGAPHVHIGTRECRIVYRHEERANIAIYNDTGGLPWVQIIPWWMTRADGSTRSFGFNEAIAVLVHTKEKVPSGTQRTLLNDAQERAWPDTYAFFLETHFDTVTHPSSHLLDAIEARRERKVEC